jgi:coenzyme F420-reducing hydrogenase gamma subunit
VTVVEDASVRTKPGVAVFKLSSCDGCQLQLLDAEDALLDLAGAVDLVYFREARSFQDEGPYDVTLVEGSVSTPAQVEEIRLIRERSRILVTIGACATAGGIQALRNFEREGRFVRMVYPTPEYVSHLATSTPISEHVNVDLEIWGCPVDRGQLLEAIASLARGVVPKLPTFPVCVECKRRGLTCVLVANDEPCLGPVTRTGCGALCPAYGRACYGCFGPADTVNTEALTRTFAEQGRSPSEIAARFRFINGWSPMFREAGETKEATGA